MKIYRQYLRKVKKQTGYLGTWNFGVDLRLGDFGVIQNKVFTKLGNLEKLIDFDIIKYKDDKPVSFEVLDSKDVQKSIKLAGEAKIPGSNLPEAKAGIHLKFKTRGSFVMSLRDSLTHRIENLYQIEQELFSLIDKKVWDKNFVIINEVVAVDLATIILAKSKNTNIDIEANADISISSFELADANVELKIAGSRASVLSTINEKDMTPLFKAVTLRRSGLRSLNKSFLQNNLNSNNPDSMIQLDSKIDSMIFTTPKEILDNRDDYHLVDVELDDDDFDDFYDKEA